MDKLILWMLMAYGMSTIIVYGHIFDRPRDWVISKSSFWGSFFTCMLCIPVWCGFFLSFALGGLTNAYFDTGNFTFFFDGMFTAGSVWAINAFVEFFEESRIK
jgi:hypothetical protein